jgi:two-component system, sensor histidine kinase RegB
VTRRRQAFTDDPRLQQAVQNLLNNAAAARRDGDPAIEIHLDWTVDRITLGVRDHGPGFPPAVLAIAGRQPLPAHANGQGVGLLLTRAAIEQLGGRLELTNPPGGGARAEIILPSLRQ